MWERRTFHTRIDDATREIDPETYRSIGNILRILRNVTNSSLSPSINAMKLNGVAPHVSFIGDEINSWPDILLWRPEDDVEDSGCIRCFMVHGVTAQRQGKY